VFGIQQGIEPVLEKKVFCPTETFTVGLPEENYTGVMVYDRGLHNLNKVEGKNRFQIPSNLAGNFRLVFTNEKQESTLPVTVSIISPSSPDKILGPDMKCLSDTLDVSISSSCSVGNLKWNTNNTTNIIKVKPVETTTYTAICSLPSCPLEPSESLTIRVIAVASSASGPNQSFSGSDIQLMASGGVNYNWSGPNGFSSFLQNPMILSAKESDAGEYNVEVTDKDGCVGMASVKLNITQLLSSFENTEIIDVYPNPTYDYLIIDHDEQIVNSQVISTIGQFMNTTIENNRVNVKHLPAGTYLLKLGLSTNEELVKKFIKN
jgi:hypothetical protein